MSTFELTDCTRAILEEIEHGVTQKSVALTYALAMRSEDRGMDTPDWPKINQAIINRWSLSGLNRVKKMAWDLIEGKDQSHE